jgi:hypothetical protein
LKCQLIPPEPEYCEKLPVAQKRLDGSSGGFSCGIVILHFDSGPKILTLNTVPRLFVLKRRGPIVGYALRMRDSIVESFNVRVVHFSDGLVHSRARSMPFSSAEENRGYAIGVLSVLWNASSCPNVAYTPVPSIFRHRNARASALTMALSTRGRGAHVAPSGVTTVAESHE